MGGALALERGDLAAQAGEQLGVGLEAVLVEVVAAPPPRAEHEVALEVGALDEPAPQLGAIRPGHPASARSSVAIGRSASASGEPLPSDIIEPSSK